MQNPGPGEYVAKDFKNPELALQTRVNVETKQEAERAKAAKALVKHQEEQAAAKEAWDPNKDPLVEGDPFKTLFVAGLPFAATEEVIRQEFEEYGPIRRIRIVTDARSGKPRGYAFVEYDHTNDMKEAYKRADGRPILGMRCIVDVERGRTVEDWKPRRLGGGLGGLRRAAKVRPLPRQYRDASAGVTSVATTGSSCL